MAETSLIPKKVAAPGEGEAGGFGIFFRIAVIFFIVAAAISGGLFLYRSILQSQLAKGQEALKNLESQFPAETIAQHEHVGNAIAASQKILTGHVKQSNTFALLEENTLPTIAYSSFAFVEADHKMTIAGEAPSYQAVAQQASVFESIDKISSATFSNLALSTKGTVSFTITILLKDSFK